MINQASDTTDYALQTINLSKRYGRKSWALQDATLRLQLGASPRWLGQMARVRRRCSTWPWVCSILPADPSVSAGSIPSHNRKRFCRASALSRRTTRCTRASRSQTC
jgi:hypothetical protein